MRNGHCQEAVGRGQTRSNGSIANTFDAIDTVQIREARGVQASLFSFL